MISLIKCQICLEDYDENKNCPKICFKCGNSVCQTCLIGIQKKSQKYICPFCKSQSYEKWPINRKILHHIQQQKSAILCQPHKRKVISLCCNIECKLPIGICELNECSKIHKQRGTNNLPLSLLSDQFQNKDTDIICQKALEIFYQELEKNILNQIKTKKLNGRKKLQNLTKNANLSKNIQNLMFRLKNTTDKTVTSKQTSEIKEQLLKQEDLEKNTIDIAKQLVSVEKEQFTKDILKLINTVKVQFSPTILKSKILQTIQQQKKAKIEQSPQFLLIKSVIKKQFKAEKIFSSLIDTYDHYFQQIKGKPNLVFRIQMQDNQVFGVYFKKNYATDFSCEYYITDPAAFVYWVNRNKIFKAAFDAQAQYDISSQYLLSVGNTYNFDGFWFKYDFKTINVSAKKKQILSEQYEGLLIPLNTNVTKCVQVYQLTF